MSKVNQLIDAVKTAKEIHEGDYSSLRGKYFVTRDKIKENNHHPGDNTVKKPNEGKMTLAKLAEEMRNGFKQVNSRIDNLEKDVNSLKQDVKDINVRIDRIEMRIDNIDARLDYNGLKRLPN